MTCVLCGSDGAVGGVCASCARKCTTCGQAHPGASCPALQQAAEPDCPVCDDRGMVAAAPVRTFAVWTGADPVPHEESRVDWDGVTYIPCWACALANLKVIA